MEESCRPSSKFVTDAKVGSRSKFLIDMKCVEELLLRVLEEFFICGIKPRTFCNIRTRLMAVMSQESKKVSYSFLGESTFDFCWNGIIPIIKLIRVVYKFCNYFKPLSGTGLAVWFETHTRRYAKAVTGLAVNTTWPRFFQVFGGGFFRDGTIWPVLVSWLEVLLL